MASVAALGGEFGLELLQAVTDQDEADVREALDELMRAELLYERGGSDVPVYVFKHAPSSGTPHIAHFCAPRVRVSTGASRMFSLAFSDTS